MTTLVSNRNHHGRFGNLLGWEPMRLFHEDLVSPIQVIDATDTTTMTVDMPGVGPEDLELTFEKGTLAIVGKRGERTYRYSVALGDSIDPNAIDATLDKGVLVIRAHKRPESQPRKIAVRTS
jgi:HSP20 family protein